MSTGAMGSGCRISGHELAPPGEGKSACYPPQLWQSQPFDNLRPRKPLYLSPEGERASPAPFEAPSFFLRRGKNERPPSTALQAFRTGFRSEEHTSELQSLMRISYAVSCLKKKTS